MKFIVPSQDLLERLLLVNGAVVSKPVLPILENFLFKIEDSKLTISSTDLETSMTTSMEVQSKDDITVAVPSKLIIETLRSLPAQPVTFTVSPEGYNIELSTANGRFKLAGLSADDYPKIQDIESTGSFQLPANLLSRAISKTLFATSTDELRQNLTGVFVELFADSVNFVATDANRLVKYSRKDIKPGIESSFIIPKKALNLLKSAVPNSDEMISIEFNNSNVSFTISNLHLICRLIEERYPDYNAVIPKDNDQTLSAERSAMLASTRRISIFSNKTTHQLRLGIIGSELTLSAEDLELANEAQESIACEFDGADLEIGFNSKFLIDMLSNLDTDQVNLKLSAPNRAGIMVPSENEENEAIEMLIMPMMLNN